MTPEPGAPKIGNLTFHVGVRADGPLQARVVVLDDDTTRLVIVGLDALSVSAAVVARIRAALPGATVMVAATHTPGSGALVRCGVVDADARYQERVVAAVVAVAKRSERALATPGAGQRTRHGVRASAQSPRRPGGTARVELTARSTIRCALWIEGPVDPELADA